MKHKFATFQVMFLACIFSFAFSFAKTETDFKEKLEFTARVVKSGSVDDLRHLSLKTTLRNLSSDTITFITMSCSYPLEYILDTKSLGIHSRDCINDISILIEIPPYKTYDRIVTLTTRSNIRQADKIHFKIAVNLTEVKDIQSTLKMKNEHIVFFTLKPYSTSLQDTTYKIGVNFKTVDSNGTFQNLDTIATNNILWSNTVELK